MRSSDLWMAKKSGMRIKLGVDMMHLQARLGALPCRPYKPTKQLHYPASALQGVLQVDDVAQLNNWTCWVSCRS